MRVLGPVAPSTVTCANCAGHQGRAFAERNARNIRDLQERGIADPDIDPLLAAAALGSMVGRMAYGTYVMGDEWKRRRTRDHAHPVVGQRAPHPR